MVVLESGKISTPQSVLLIMGFIFGSSVLFTPGREIGHDAWFTLILGALEGLMFALTAAALVVRFPGKTLVEIADIVWGRFWGQVISITFLWYLFHLGATVTTNYLDFIKTSILPQTPAAVVVLFGLFICATAAWSGVEVLSRCSEVLVPLTIIIFMGTVLLLLDTFDLGNFLPALQTPPGQLLRAGHGAATFPFGESVILLMLLPFLQAPSQAPKSALFALAGAAIFLLVATVRTTGVLGQAAKIYNYPAFHATRLIDVADVFTRLEILTALNFLTMAFLKIGVLIYAVSLGVAQLLRLKSYRPLVTPVYLLMSFVSLYNFSGISANVEFADKIYPIYALPYQLFIPLVTLGLAIIRKLSQEDAA